MQRVSCALFLLAGVLGLPTASHAGSVLFTGSGPGEEGATLNASALFNISGSTLTITLTNKGDNASKDVNGNLLTGVFFDLPSGVTLVPLSATVKPGAIINPTKCDVADCATRTDVGGEFGYGRDNVGSWNDGSTGPSANHGIGASGYIFEGDYGTMFPGIDLDAPANPNGPNFGIAPGPTSDITKVPLIKEQVVFTLSIKKSGKLFTDLQTGDISNVTFQYGTGFNQPKFPGSFTPPGVPEPAMLLLAAPAAILVRRRFRRR